MSTDDMFAPPLNRAMKVLDRSFFRKTIPTSAARVFNSKDISRCRSELEKAKDSIKMSRIPSVREDPDPERARTGTRCIVLRPEVLHNDRTTWSPKLQSLEQEGLVGVIPYNLQLDYDFWTYAEILHAIIPQQEDGSDELPTGFSQAGHVAHLNLRDKYVPYKDLIATVLADKNPNVRTVINKIDNVGAENEFRTFQYEVLHGPNDLNVMVHEQDCAFSFDFAKVYWNSRLHTEHERLCSIFNPGEAVCDVMAGVGPFAIPAGKKRVFVFANDLNPDSYASLEQAVKKNKVGDFVVPFNTNGREFIRAGTADLLNSEHSVPIYPKKVSRSAAKGAAGPPKPVATYVRPKLFSHYVMNLPASALTFLPSFVGLYADVPGMPAESIRKLFAPHTEIPLPMVHAYCFSTKSDDNVEQAHEICAEISRHIGYTITPETPDTEIFDVRDVAPKKRMFCASFRLPEEVVFRGA
ncbi:guanine-N(1)--methyltransferas-like protein [Delitschia confertaspora ATCC 74209]|uniref:tRNA (guanine(37)-N1)-methyltransferase n=1 Tax=Delitschia confertaspora ATCC 74209 TaxID=1513339 RepID=A0A9P4JVW0_9PLEO|nr:guanine-N(1)--methyltransferas-like protein [Delitschia confertaspora ATCC 74209]